MTVHAYFIPKGQARADKLSADVSFLKTAAASYAVIDNSKPVDLCAVYAQGDRRRRPLGWMQKADVNALYENGHLKPCRKGLVFTYAAERALIEDRWCLRPDLAVIEGDEKTVYVPSGVQRQVKRRHSGHILRRLANDRDAAGRLLFSAHELEAGEQFQRDYAKAYGTAIGGQNFTGVTVDKMRQNSQEMAAVIRIDAGAAYQSAKAVLGIGLEKAADVICGEGKSFAQLEREQFWARGAGRTILKLALQRLALYYGTIPGQDLKR